MAVWRPPARVAAADTRMRSPAGPVASPRRQAPQPRAAHHRLHPAGVPAGTVVTPTTGSPATSRAIWVPHPVRPTTNRTVPSMPSTIQRRAAGPDSPTSSPSRPSPGRSAARISAMRRSTARSAAETGEPSGLISWAMAAPVKAASVSSSAASASRSASARSSSSPGVTVASVSAAVGPRFGDAHGQSGVALDVELAGHALEHPHVDIGVDVDLHGVGPDDHLGVGAARVAGLAEQVAGQVLGLARVEADVAAGPAGRLVDALDAGAGGRVGDVLGLPVGDERAAAVEDQPGHGQQADREDHDEGRDHALVVAAAGHWLRKASMGSHATSSSVTVGPT